MLSHTFKLAVIRNLFTAMLLMSWPLLGTAEPVTKAAFGADKPGLVTVWNREIVQLRAPFEQFTPEQRAVSVIERILAIPGGQKEYKVEAVPGTLGSYTGAWIYVNQRLVFGLLTEDADSENGQSFDELKKNTVANLQAWLAIRAEQEKLPAILKGIALSFAATLAFGLAVWVSLHYGGRWLAKRSGYISNGSAKPLIIGDVDVKPYLISLEIGVFKMLIWGLVLVWAYLCATFVLNQFPYSEPWGEQLSAFLLHMFKDFGVSMVQATPDLFTVLVIFLLTRLFVRVITAFFHSAETGIFQSVWLQPETARATRRLVVVLVWIFALVVAYPYIPGSQTEAFKGVSVFVGLMLSLGSAGMVGQIVGGLVVVYSGAFRSGEYVKIGEYEGFIREIGMLSTKMTTVRQEQISIPNAVLVGTTAVNYSRHAEGGSAVLSTSVTIGYDTPWRQVHGMLLLAAERTADIIQDPPPRVLQRSLSDFYVEYQLLFRIRNPEQRFMILSELHGQIQDAFNEFGVQIMSPHFEMQPNKAVVVPKPEWRKPPARL